MQMNWAASMRHDSGVHVRNDTFCRSYSLSLICKSAVRPRRSAFGSVHRLSPLFWTPGQTYPILYAAWSSSAYSRTANLLTFQVSRPSILEHFGTSCWLLAIKVFRSLLSKQRTAQPWTCWLSSARCYCHRLSSMSPSLPRCCISWAWSTCWHLIHGAFSEDDISKSTRCWVLVLWTCI